MARLSTCKGCDKKLLPEEKHMHNSKGYCSECFSKIERESTEYKQLIEFICMNYDLERPTGFMLKQIKEMKTEFNFSYSAMTYTLWYCKEVLNKKFIEKYGVVLIKHYYEEAKNYYTQQEKMKQQVSQLADVEMKTKVLKNTSVHVDKRKDTSLINLDSLLEGGDTH